MLMLLVDLAAERIKQDPIPVGLLAVFTMVLQLLDLKAIQHENLTTEYLFILNAWLIKM